MTDPSDALLVVVGGPTGVGKSTLVNTLVGRTLSDVGVLRPTTRVPVVVHHPGDAPPSLAGLETSPVVVADETCPPGIVLVDSPDLDSVETANRAAARALIDVADVWLAVLSPPRYADRTAWEALRRATRAGLSTAVVLARVGEDAGAVPTYVARLMREEGLLNAPLFVVPDGEMSPGLLPQDAVADVGRLLAVLSQHPDARAEIRASRAALR